MIKYYRRKNESILEIGENRVILSDPEIQPFNEFLYRSKRDIFHFYYNMKIQLDTNAIYFSMTDEEREECEKEDGHKIQHNWVTVAKNYITEFGIIDALEECINTIIRSNPDEGQKDYLKSADRKTRKIITSDTDYESMYEINLRGLLQEDQYILKKHHRHIETFNYRKNKDICHDEYYYSIYIGAGGESRDNSTGIFRERLSKKELLIIKKWAKDFMNLAKERTQKKIEWMFTREAYDGEEKYYTPSWFERHMREKYPEDYPKWKEIWIKLYEEDFILKEYFKYVKGETIEDALFSKYTGEKVVAQELIKENMKDWEAYCKLVDFYRKR